MGEGEHLSDPATFAHDHHFVNAPLSKSQVISGIGACHSFVGYMSEGLWTPHEVLIARIGATI